MDFEKYITDSLFENDPEKVKLYSSIMKAAYNQAIEDAAENAEIDDDFGNPYDPSSLYYFVKKSSILKLKKP